jgi:hypothetical protein
MSEWVVGVGYDKIRTLLQKIAQHTNTYVCVCMCVCMCVCYLCCTEQALGARLAAIQLRSLWLGAIQRKTHLYRELSMCVCA